MNRAFLPGCFFFFVQVVSGQSLSPYSFYHYSMPGGLASNEVFGVVQDRTGYMWIATNYGLQRFDGVQYKTFRHNAKDPASLPENVIVQVFLDKEGQLWVLTEGGQVGVFDQNKFTYKAAAVRPNDRASPRYTKRCITDEDGHIFLLITGFELLQYNKAKNEFSAAGNFIPLKPEWGITTLSQQPGTQKYWIGLQGGGLLIYNGQTGHLNYPGHNVDGEPAVERTGSSGVANSMFDAQGRFWFDSWATYFPYAVYFDPKKPSDSLHRYEFVSTVKTYNETGGFIQQRDGRIWLRGLKLFGYFDEAKNSFSLIASDSKNEQGILYEEVTWLYEDREKNVWVCTRNNGLYCFNPSLQFFTNIPHIQPGTGAVGAGGVMSFMETRSGDLFAGAWGEGMYRYKKDLQNIPLGIRGLRKGENPFAWSMCPSADSNTIWIAAQPGLYQYNQATETIRFRNPAILQNRTIRQVAEDKAGHLWLGMHNGGLYRWMKPGNEKDSLIKLPELGPVSVRQLVADSKGLVWVATELEGLLLYDGRTGKFLNRWNKNVNNESGIGDFVTGILEYNDSLMVVSSATALFFYNRHSNSLAPFPLPEAFMGAVMAMQKDDNGFIWVSTTNALYRLHPKKRAVVLFNRLDGIGNDRFVESSSYKMRDGRLLFGNSTSFIVFDPKAIRLSDKLPPVVFTGIKVGDRELPVDSIMGMERLSLGSKDNSITVEFSSLTYAAYSLIQYKMEGINEVWKMADKDNRATFPFLPPAKYRLLLRTLDVEGNPSAATTVLQIRVRPPFYQTWWFYTLVAIGLAFELYWLDRQRGLRKKGLQKVRTDIWDNLHKEVNEALNNINILSEIARLKSDKEPQKSKEYLEQIHAKSHNMIIAMDDMLWSLDPQNDSMDKTINRIKEFADALMQRHPVSIELLIDKNVERLQLNMKLRHEAFLLFKEGLRGLVEAGTPHCIVHLAMEKAKLLFTIEFENEGCDMQQLNNLLQRRDMEARLQSLKARLDVQLHKSRSVFLLQLPLG